MFNNKTSFISQGDRIQNEKKTYFQTYINAMSM